MVQNALLPALPFLEEETRDYLAHVAWEHGRQELARSLFLDFLTIDSSGLTLDPTDEAIEADILKRGLATRERLGLYRARRQLNLLRTQSDKDKAAELLEGLWNDRRAPADVRAEAGYESANYYRLRRPSRELVEVLNGVIELAGDGAVAEKALYRRGMLRFGEERIADLHELASRYPASRLADDALFQIATTYLFGRERESPASWMLWTGSLW